MTRLEAACVLWLTGLSGAGKSTLASKAEAQLAAAGLPVINLDGDKVRRGLSSDLGFSRRDRQENIRRIGELARLLADAGNIVVVSAISPFEADRSQAKAIIGAERFCEIHVACPLQRCIERDTKGLYRLAISGAIPEFTGISSPYEEPSLPALVLNTDVMTEEMCVRALVELAFRVVNHPPTQWGTG